MTDTYRRESDDQQALTAEPDGVRHWDRILYALSWFVENGCETTVEEWALHVTAFEHEVDLDDVDRSKREHQYAWLYFSLVPRLIDEGLVEQTATPDGSVVSAAVPVEQFESRLELLERQHLPGSN